MSLVFFFLRNVPTSGLCLPSVGEGEAGEEAEASVGGDSPLSMVSVPEEGKQKEKSPTYWSTLLNSNTEQLARPGLSLQDVLR